MIRVVVTGSECTGKTTLARDLARRYDAVWVPEHAREFVEDKGAAPAAADVEAIARGQIAAEERHAARAGELLVLDTDLISTVVYARHYYGGVADWIQAAAHERLGDLYLLAHIDVPWTPDRDLRDRPGRRPELQRLFAAELARVGAVVVAVAGPAEARLRRSVLAIDRLLAERRGGAGA